MSGKEADIPVTPAIRQLRESGLAFELSSYEAGGSGCLA